MKKAVKIIFISLLLSGLLLVMNTYVESEAAAANIGSKGNFVLEDGENVSFYSSDIYYLQDELESLFNEIN